MRIIAFDVGNTTGVASISYLPSLTDILKRPVKLNTCAINIKDFKTKHEFMHKVTGLAKDYDYIVLERFAPYAGANLTHNDLLPAQIIGAFYQKYDDNKIFIQTASQAKFFIDKKHLEIYDDDRRCVHEYDAIRHLLLFMARNYKMLKEEL